MIKSNTTRRKNIFFKTAGVFMIVLMSLSSCEKRTTPKRVSRLIADHSWKITSFTYQDSLITDQFAGYVLNFAEGGSISVANNFNLVGYWNMGSDKNPAIMYIEGFTDTLFTKLDDDWIVRTATKDRITMEAYYGAVVNDLVLIPSN